MQSDFWEEITMRKIKGFIVLLVIIGLLSALSIIYFNFSKLNVKLNAVDVYSVENDTYLDANISKESLKKEILENPNDYYFASINASLINNKKIGYNRWKLYTSNTFDDKKIFFPIEEPECFHSSIVHPDSMLENIGFTVIVYYEDGSEEMVKSFLLEELDVYAVGYPVI